MWEFLRKIGLAYRQVRQSLPCPAPHGKAASDSANRAAGREELAKLLPTIGSDESIPSMVQLVLDTDVYVRGHAKLAAAEAVTSEKATESFRSAFWDALVQDLLSDRVEETYDPVRFLMKLDRDKALNLLNTPAFLRPDHPLFRVILQTLVFETDLDCATISHLRRAVPGDSELQNKLRFAAAKAHCPGIGAELDSILADQVARQPCDFQEWNYISASRARLALCGLRHQESLSQEEANSEFTQVKEDLGNIGVLNIIGDYQFYDGAGFAGLFSREECNDPGNLIASLRRLNLPKHIRIFESAMQLFNGQAPWPSQEIRREMREALESSHNTDDDAGTDIFDDLEAEWIKLNRDLVVAAEEYAFKAASQTKQALDGTYRSAGQSRRGL
jgi:hypothetical protein